MIPLSNHSRFKYIQSMKSLSTLKDHLYKYYLLYLLLIFFFPMRNRVKGSLRGVIWSDCEGYYMYLPAVFIQKDVHQMQHGSIVDTQNDKGEFVDKFTCGVAMLQMPFFLVAKAIADYRGYDPMDFFSDHYAMSIAIGGYLIGFLGLLFLKRGLRLHYSRWVVFLTIIGVFFGTNLFHYATKEMGMSHVYSFMLFAFLVWRVPLFYRNPNGVMAFVLGLVAGWIVLIRPTNILVLLFIVLYGIEDLKGLRDRVLWWLQHAKYIGYAFVGALLIMMPQFLYWHEMTGHFIFYSYQGEGFPYWNNPKILAVLFDTQNGLLMYSPLVIFMLLGIVLGWKKPESQAKVVALIFVLATYIFSSWWAWWFGGAFGHRSYVELYAFMSLPLAYFLSVVINSKSKFQKFALYFVFVFFTYYSVGLSYLYRAPWDGPDWRWNLDKMMEIWSQLFVV